MIHREASAPYKQEKRENTDNATIEQDSDFHPITKFGKEIFDKIFRTISAYILPVDPNRIGKCFQCGKCCELAYRCPFLVYDASGKSVCTIYTSKILKLIPLRPENCSKYPRSKSEQKHPATCGYKFKKP